MKEKTHLHRLEDATILIQIHNSIMRARCYKASELCHKMNSMSELINKRCDNNLFKQSSLQTNKLIGANCLKVRN